MRAAFATAAESFIGVRFRFRGLDPRTGLDCAGLVAAALGAVGLPVPAVAHYAIRQRDFGRQLDQDIYITENKAYLEQPLYRDGEHTIHAMRQWARQFYPDMEPARPPAAGDTTRVDLEA